MTNNDKMLERVRALLAKADSTNFPEEADAFRAKADELMTAYAIEQWMIDEAQAGVNARPKPESRDIDTSWYWTNSRKDELWSLFHGLARHCRCKVIYWRGYNTTPVIGLPSDLDYFDMLFTHLMLQMAKGLEPKPDPARSMIDNLIRMKEAGMKWARIGELLYDIGQLDEPYTRNTGVRFTKLYADACREQGRPQLRVAPSVYQRSYAMGFVNEVKTRLRNQAKLTEEKTSGNDKALALRDIKHVIDELADEMYGKPPRSRAVSRDVRTDMNAYQTGVSAGRDADLAANPHNRVGSRRQIGR